MKTENEMFDYVKSVVKETGKLPAQKEFIIGGEWYKFYRVNKRVDKQQYYYTCNPDDYNCDYPILKANKHYGKTYFQILYYQNFLELVGNCNTKSETRAYID